MGLFGPSRKKQLAGIVGGLPDDMPLPPIINPIHDPRESQEEYDPSGAPSPGPQKGGGFFGKGGAGRGIAGTIGDYLLQQAHMQPVYAPAMEHQRDTDTRLQMYQQQRKDALEDWQTQQEYKAAHPDPAGPNDTERDMELIRSTLGDDAARSFLESKANPTQYMQVKDPATGELRIIPVPKGGGGQPAGGPQPGTVRNGYRFKGGNPNDPSAWEEAGGAGSQAPRGFLGRRPY